MQIIIIQKYLKTIRLLFETDFSYLWIAQSSNIIKSTAIDAETRMIEIFKEKQNLEIKNLIENEMRNYLIRLENEEMLNKEKEKNELN